MFYFLSKLLDFLLLPSFWVFMLIILAFFRKAKRKKYLAYALLIFIVFGNQFIYNSLLSSLEAEPYDQQLFPEKYEAGILLGGYGKYGHKSKRMELGESADRLSQCLALYHSKKIKKIIVSSGAFSPEYPEKKEALITKDFLIKAGVKAKDVLVETESLNTYQNARYTKSIIAEANIEGPFLLITSSFHMRRAKACFDTQKIETICYPVDYHAEKRKFDLEFHILPNTQTLVNWKILLKEIVGYWVYDIKGYID